MNLNTLDLSVVVIYAVVLLVLAQWVSREKAGHQKDSSDYFLAGRALPWWAIGASLIAANISAEQIIGIDMLEFLRVYLVQFPVILTYYLCLIYI